MCKGGKAPVSGRGAVAGIEGLGYLLGGGEVGAEQGKHLTTCPAVGM